MASTFPQTVLEVLAASKKFVKGDPTDFIKLWSHHSDVSIFGSFGGYKLSWTQVKPRLIWASSQYANGTFKIKKMITKVRGMNIAYTVHLEHIEATISGVPSQVQELRVTQIFRREGHTWLIIHRHADTLGA